MVDITVPQGKFAKKEWEGGTERWDELRLDQLRLDQP